MEHTVRKSVAQRLKMIRVQLGMTQKEFGASLDMKQGSYSALERGDPISKRVERLLVVKHNVNLKYLYDNQGSMFLKSGDKEIPERLLKIADHFDLTTEELATKLKIGLTEMSNILNFHIPADSRLLNKVYDAFGGVSSEWLEKGVGPMIDNVRGPKVNTDTLINKLLAVIDELKDKIAILQSSHSQLTETNIAFSERIKLLERLIKEKDELIKEKQERINMLTAHD